MTEYIVDFISEEDFILIKELISTYQFALSDIEKANKVAELSCRIDTILASLQQE
jgi:hypothetical protein